MLLHLHQLYILINHLTVFCKKRGGSREIHSTDFMSDLLELMTINNMIIALKVIVDIGIIWLIFYYTLTLVQNNRRTLQIVKGIMIILIVRLIASTFDLQGIAYIVNAIMNWGVVALIVVFHQPILCTELPTAHFLAEVLFYPKFGRKAVW